MANWRAFVGHHQSNVFEALRAIESSSSKETLTLSQVWYYEWELGAQITRKL